MSKTEVRKIVNKYIKKLKFLKEKFFHNDKEKLLKILDHIKK